ncbi:MAG: hypothetical protein ACK442_05660 [Novosphingobium sp.]|jgi:hypothetical protein|nr:hypothetical protein [Brevundimonas sp.]MCZ8321569.1 hypothetical protein [Novosphingobium sp.]
MRRTTFALALLSLPIPALAQAQQPPCLTAQEFTAVSTFALPGVIRGAAQRCQAVLPQQAFLRSQSENLAQRYSRGRDKAWPEAKAAFIKIGGGTDPQAANLFRSMPDDTLKPFVEGAVSTMVSQQLPTDRCSAVDRLVMLLSPLPPESTAEVIGLAAGLGARGGQAKVGKLAICKA